MDPTQPLVSSPPSGFGSTVFDSFAQSVQPALASGCDAPKKGVFDVCHIGVVLRSVLFVHGVLGVALLFGAQVVWDWLMALATASAVALPAVLMWLLGACYVLTRLKGLSTLRQTWVGMGLGALAGGFGWSLGQLSGLGLFDQHLLWPQVCAGVGFAWAMTGWLQLRDRGHLPALTQARLNELQSRIRPHFLFNTLNTALSLVHHEPTKAEGVLEDLAELFRVALSESGASVSLGEEIELAKRYLDIEQIRFGQRMQVVWQLDPLAALARVPPLVLQPLVENAVRHGIEPSLDGGVLRIRTHVKMGRVYVSIANSISGQPSTPGHGIALANVRERLHLMHDVAAQFETRVHQNTYYVQIGVPL